MQKANFKRKIHPNFDCFQLKIKAQCEIFLQTDQNRSNFSLRYNERERKSNHRE